MKYDLEVDSYNLDSVSAVSVLLENLEQVVFYKGEITDIYLEFEPEIALSALGLKRKLKRGRIVVQIDQSIKRHGVCLWNLNGEQIDMIDYKVAVIGRLIGHSDITHITITEGKLGRKETIIAPYKKIGDGDTTENSRTLVDNDCIRILLGDW